MRILRSACDIPGLVANVRPNVSIFRAPRGHRNYPIRSLRRSGHGRHSRIGPISICRQPEERKQRKIMRTHPTASDSRLECAICAGRAPSNASTIRRSHAKGFAPNSGELSKIKFGLYRIRAEKRRNEMSHATPNGFHRRRVTQIGMKITRWPIGAGQVGPKRNSKFRVKDNNSFVHVS